jgi:signal transduction histidine kinase
MGRQPTMQWISYIMIFSVLLVFILEYPVGQSAWRFYGTVLLLAALMVLNVLWYLYHEEFLSGRLGIRSHLAFNIFTDLLGLGAIALTGRPEVVFLLFMLVSQFAFIFGVWPLGILHSLILLAATMGMLIGFGVTPADLITSTSEITVGLVFVQVCILLLQRSTQETERAGSLLKELQAAHAELQAAQEKEKELAVAEERVRLARDIHDGLGHHLTVLSIQLQAADKLVERNPRAAAEAIRISRAEAQAALEEVRRSVGVMRESPSENRPLAERLAGLVRDFDQRTGLSVSFEQGGVAPDLSEFAKQTYFRAVQEGLTNAQKHGRGVRRIDVNLTFEADTVRLRIHDDGQVAQSSAAGKTGYGLTGLRERVEQLGGTFRAGPEQDGGFAIELRIPLPEDGHD